MIKFFVGAYRGVCDFFDRFFVALTLIAGSICLYYGITGHSGDPDIKKLLHTIGSLALASGIFAGVAKSNQFTEIYRKILREIVYGKEHLENRKDLEKIWENVTEVLSNQKFSKISNKMRANIKKYFLPLDHDYYYDNYHVDITIEQHPENSDYVILKETITYTIVCDDDELVIDNRYVGRVKVDLARKDMTYLKITHLSVDGEMVPNVDLKQEMSGNFLICKYERKLRNKKTYFIKREEEKQYNLNYNPIRRTLAVWIYNNCSIEVTYPKTISIEFNNMGVLDEFKVDDKPFKDFNRLKAEYKGLIYKNQGFFLHLRK